MKSPKREIKDKKYDRLCVDVEFLGGKQDADISWVSLKHVHLGGLGARGVSCKQDFHLPVRCFYNSTQFPRDVVISISRIVQSEQYNIIYARFSSIYTPF